MSVSAIIERSKRDKEAWRYTDLEKLLSREPAPTFVALPHPEALKIEQSVVFMNGVFSAERSNFGMLSAAILHGDAKSGYRLTLAAQSCLVTAPIELVFLGDAAHETHLKLDIDVGPNASAMLLSRHVAMGTALVTIESRIHLASHAKLQHQKFLMGDGHGTHLARTEVKIDDGAYYRNFSMIKDTRLVRNEIDVTLAKPMAQCALDGCMLLRGTEHADTLTRTTHTAPHCTSRQLYKSVVTDKAHGVFQGKIIVAEGAQKTDGQQLSRALLLSDQAEMNAKPELEIYADDVSCSHGTTIGDLDADSLFYLRTRGLSEAAARALLLRAFVGELIEDMPSDRATLLAQTESERWFDECK